MSTTVTPPPGPLNNGQPAKPAAADAASVIRRLGGAEETTAERLVQKHLPAWVISGAIHVGVILVAFLLFSGRTADTRAEEKIITTTVEKDEEEKKPDLTNEDLGVESEIPQTVESEREADKNAEAKVTEDIVGAPDATSNDSAALAVPGVPGSDATTPGVMGDAGQFAAGAGAGGTTVSSFNGRSGGAKDKLVKEGGGNMESEAAVARGLAWLAKQQLSTGGWLYDGSHKNEQISSTGMALLPFLAAGQTHRAGKYQKNVAAGIGFLIKNLQSSGQFRGAGMYAHAIGAVALCECYGMTKDKALLLGAAQKSINFIVTAQGADGSWGYGAGATGDTSIVGWQIQALKAAQLTKDITVPPNTIKRAVEFLDKVSGGSRKETYGYSNGPGSPGSALTAVGLLSRYYTGWAPNNAGYAKGVDDLLRVRPPKKGAALDMYYFYYATQVVHFYEKDAWHKQWNPMMRDWLIELQEKKENSPNYGSWAADGGSIGSNCGRVGTTALVLLTLEVYYRHLPLYKRDNAGLKEFDRNAN